MRGKQGQGQGHSLTPSSSKKSGKQAMIYVIVAAIAVAIIVAVIIYFSTSKKSSFANPPSNGATKTTLFYSPTCPHCVSLMPVWRQIEEAHGSKVAKVNVAEHPGIFAEQGLTGVPAIKKGTLVHSGPRTFEAISQFVKSG
jgi:thiol-disulfide isomerase/thioredoxin